MLLLSIKHEIKTIKFFANHEPPAPQEVEISKFLKAVVLLFTSDTLNQTDFSVSFLIFFHKSNDLRLCWVLSIFTTFIVKEIKSYIDMYYSLFCSYLALLYQIQTFKWTEFLFCLFSYKIYCILLNFFGQILLISYLPMCIWENAYIVPTDFSVSVSFYYYELWWSHHNIITWHIWVYIIVIFSEIISFIQC